MRYLVLSDIHSNIEALEAAMDRAGEAGYDRVLCCGDIVGYGPNPVEVIDRILESGAVCIRGNHDRVAAGIDEPFQFSPIAREAIEWTRARLPESYRRRLEALPSGPLDIGPAQLVHGGFLDEDEYLYSEADAEVELGRAQRRVTFFGHTHIATVFAEEDGGTSEWIPRYGQSGAAEFALTSRKCMANPGSVGQPRDDDWRASFLIWDIDADKLEFYRVPYRVNITQEKMRATTLPQYLSYRLTQGR